MVFFFIANNLHNNDLGPTYNHGRNRSGTEDNSEPPRPPPPRPEGINNLKISLKSEKDIITYACSVSVLTLLRTLSVFFRCVLAIF